MMKMADVYELDEKANNKMRAIQAEQQIARQKLQSLRKEQAQVIQDFINREELDLAETQVNVEQRQDGKRVLVATKEEE